MVETDVLARLGAALAVADGRVTVAAVTALSLPYAARRYGPFALRVALVAAVAGLVLRLAWIGDDALITLRHALNFTHGWGAGFNAAETVQGYTHPLWFLLWSGVGAATGEWVVTILAVGVVATAAAAVVVVFQAPTPGSAAVATAALAVSNAFMEYGASGLEQPLAYLTVGVAVSLAARRRPPTVLGAVGFGVAVAAVVLTRFDLALVVAGVVGVWGWRWRGCRRGWWRLGGFAAGFGVPVAAWTGWALATYGSVLPATLTAKTNVNIPAAELVGRGVGYLATSLRADVGTAAVLAGALVAVVVWGGAVQRAVAAGSAVYLGYVVWVGGDFMAGRFLAVPVYALTLAAVLAYRDRSADLPDARRMAPLWAAATLAALVAPLAVAQFGLQGAAPTALTDPQQPRWGWRDASGVADERGVYVGEYRYGASEAFSGDLSTVPLPTLAALRAAAAGYPARVDGGPARVDAVEVTNELCGGLGAGAVLDGPGVHWVDRCGLTDLFLAGQPFTPRPADPPAAVAGGVVVPTLRWRAGHLPRDVPDGYLAAVASGDPAKVDDPRLAAQLAELWARIRPPQPGHPAGR